MMPYGVPPFALRGLEEDLQWRAGGTGWDGSEGRVGAGPGEWCRPETGSVLKLLKNFLLDLSVSDL